MAYSLKSVHYKNQQRKILLQNENGPCPLLAAANALLLSAQTHLPPASVRNNVASIDDVVNMLAGHALKRHIDNRTPRPSSNTASAGSENDTTTNPAPSEENDANAAATAHHIDELLKLFPSLQHGMDVNPKFTLGPTAYEYTNGLGAFDIMGVDLVHGWLLDGGQDNEIASHIGSKSYNELVEIVIKGNDAMEKADTLARKMNELLSEEKDEITMDNAGSKQDETTGERKIQEHQEDSQNILDTEKLEEMKRELEVLNETANVGLLVKQFLESTCNQLTYTGLTELHSHIKEGHLCVFFRNNHFATLTKNEGILYLLITDLGYAGVKEAVWEKLDDISGDTELYDAYFCKLQVKSIDPSVAVPNLTPEQLLAQRGQSEADFQLALELSRTGQVNNSSLADREGDLIAAATQLSLQEYNNQDSGTTADIPLTLDRNTAEGYTNQGSNVGAGGTLANDLQKMSEERDREMAMRLQTQLNATNAASERETLELEARRRRRAADGESGCFIC